MADCVSSWDLQSGISSCVARILPSLPSWDLLRLCRSCCTHRCLCCWLFLSSRLSQRSPYCWPLSSRFGLPCCPGRCQNSYSLRLWNIPASPRSDGMPSLPGWISLYSFSEDW